MSAVSKRVEIRAFLLLRVGPFWLERIIFSLLALEGAGVKLSFRARPVRWLHPDLEYPDLGLVAREARFLVEGATPTSVAPVVTSTTGLATKSIAAKSAAASDKRGASACP